MISCKNTPAGVSPVLENLRPRYVVVSGYHDYRSKRKANLHFIADELKKQGETIFVSVRYSYLTQFREDPRHDLRSRANRFEAVDGIFCYLWRTPLHPFRLPKWLKFIEKAAFAFFALRMPSDILHFLDKADIVFIESGIAVTFACLIRSRNSQAKIVYMASDSLSAIGQAQTIKECFSRDAHAFDLARIPSPFLSSDIPPTIPCCFIPHGIDKDLFKAIGSSPFVPGTYNAVSVGSMLFDPVFFEVAARSFPNINFHVIGSGEKKSVSENVRFYPEMPFDQTLPFLKHCSFAVAPYGLGAETYLTHTSMKLMQYAHLGVPAVCPFAVSGDYTGRFGYAPGDPESIKLAINAALSSGAFPCVDHMSWHDVTTALLVKVSEISRL